MLVIVPEWTASEHLDAQCTVLAPHLGTRREADGGGRGRVELSAWPARPRGAPRSADLSPALQAAAADIARRTAALPRPRKAPDLLLCVVRGSGCRGRPRPRPSAHAVRDAS